MNRTTLVLLLLLIISAAGNVSYVLTGLSRQKMARHTGAQRLSLNDGQRARFEVEQREMKERRAAFLDQMTQLRHVMASEFKKETPNRRLLVETSSEMSRIQAAKKPESIDSLLRLHAMLGETQRMKLSEIVKTGTDCCAACPDVSVFSK